MYIDALKEKIKEISSFNENIKKIYKKWNGSFA